MNVHLTGQIKQALNQLDPVTRQLFIKVWNILPSKHENHECMYTSYTFSVSYLLIDWDKTNEILIAFEI